MFFLALSIARPLVFLLYIFHAYFFLFIIRSYRTHHPAMFFSIKSPFVSLAEKFFKFGEKLKRSLKKSIKLFINMSFFEGSIHYF